MRGDNIYEKFPVLANLKDIPKIISLPDGTFDLEKVIGSRNKTQEMKALKSLAAFSILHKDRSFRKTCSDALDFCSRNSINDVYVKEQQIYLKVGNHSTYLCDIPEDFCDTKIHKYKE